MNKTMKNSMSAIVLALLLSVAGMTNALAQTQLATLQHGGNITVYYGASALSEAHNAAETGDVITLSSGAFTMDTITKAVTIHGAGFVTDSVSGTAPTIINSDIAANVPQGTASLTVEGVLFSRGFKVKNLTNPHFIKCYFYLFNTDPLTLLMSPQFVNCRFGTVSIEQCTNSSFINCVVWSITKSGTGMEAYNSIIKLSTTTRLTMSVFNCIVVNGGASNIWLSEESVAFNCVGEGAGATYVFRYAFNENCWSVNGGLASLMENYTGNQLTEPFILKAEAANTYIGTDGTQIGIHGGPYPYNDHPHYMTIKHCTVGERTTENGQLGVDIEVVTEE